MCTHAKRPRGKFLNSDINIAEYKNQRVQFAEIALKSSISCHGDIKRSNQCRLRAVESRESRFKIILGQVQRRKFNSPYGEELNPFPLSFFSSPTLYHPELTFVILSSFELNSSRELLMSL